MTKFLKYFFESNESLKSWMRKNPNSHIGENWKIDRTIEKHHPLTKDQHSAVAAYSGHSKHLNHALLDSHKNGAPLEEYHKSQIKHLDDITHKPIGKELHVHSGVGFDPREHFKEGDDHFHLHLPAYTSATIDKNMAKMFSNAKNPPEKHILHVHMKSTDKGHYLGSRSMNPEEHEVILPRNTKLKVNKTPEIHETDHGKYHIWHSEIEN